jgi:nucleoside-diphosphate-sugar epimerase
MDAGSLHGRAVLVTGADGLIGSHLSRALLDAGADVVVATGRRSAVWSCRGSTGASTRLPVTSAMQA